MQVHTLGEYVQFRSQQHSLRVHNVEGLGEAVGAAKTQVA